LPAVSSDALLLRMFLVVNHLTVGILFLVDLFLLRPRQAAAIGFDVCVLLLLNGSASVVTSRWPWCCATRTFMEAISTRRLPPLAGQYRN
jgi:hypothetical protein